MSDNLKIKFGKFAVRALPAKDADGVDRLLLAHPMRAGVLVYDDFGRAVKTAGMVLDDNPRLVAQVRQLNQATGVFARYGVAVERRLR